MLDSGGRRPIPTPVRVPVNRLNRGVGDAKDQSNYAPNYTGSRPAWTNNQVREVPLSNLNLGVGDAKDNPNYGPNAQMSPNLFSMAISQMAEAARNTAIQAAAAARQQSDAARGGGILAGPGFGAGVTQGATAGPTIAGPGETPAVAPPTSTDPTTGVGTGNPVADQVISGIGGSRGEQEVRTNRRSPRAYNSLTDQELRRLASRRLA